MANKIGIVLALDGEKEFSQGLKTATSAAKEAQSQLKQLDSEYSGSANSMEALKAKQEALTNAQEKYNAKLSAAQSGEQHAQTNLDKTKQAYEDLKKQVEEAQRALDEMNNAGLKGTSAYADQEAKVNQLNEALSKQGIECGKAQQKVYDYQTKVNGAQTELNNMNKEVEENEQYLKEAESSTDGCATSIDEYGNKVQQTTSQVDQFSSETQQATTVTTSWADKLKQAFANAAVTAGMQLLRKGVQELKQAFKEMVEVGSEFESSMSYVSAVSGATGSDLDALTAKAKELGSSTKFTASEVSDAFGYMSLAGWDTEQMLDGISGVLDLAAASGMELADASDMVTDYLSAFNMEASQATEVADMLAFAQANSNTTVEQLGEAYGNCAASLNAAGQDIETVTALLEAMANQGEKGSTAGTALNAVMRDISNNMEDGAIKIGDTTVAVADQEGNFRDLTDIIADVEAATDGLGTAETRTALSSTFTSRSMSAMNLILNEGSEAISEYEDALRNADGAASDMADTMQDNLSGDMTKLNSALEGLGIAVFDYFDGPLRSAAQIATTAIAGITDAITPEENAVDSMIKSSQEAITSLQGVQESTHEMMDEAQTSADELVASGENLIRLNDIEDKTVTQQETMKGIVDDLSGSIPQLSQAFNEETGQVELTDKAIRQLIESQKDLMLNNAMQTALQDETQAIANATLEYTKAQMELEKLQEKADFWNSDYWTTEATQDIEGALDVMRQARDDGVITQEEFDALNVAIVDAAAGSTDALTKVLVGYSSTVNTELSEQQTVVDEAGQLVDDLTEEVDQYTEALERNVSSQEKEEQVAEERANREMKMNEIEQEGTNIATHNREERDNFTATLNKETGEVTTLTNAEEDLATVEETLLDSEQEYVDVNGNTISSLEELEDATISAADADKELCDEEGNSIGTMGDYAAAIEEVTESVDDLRISNDELTSRMGTAYDDAFNSVQSAYNELRDSVSQGIDIDFRTSFNGGADETVESMLATAQENNEALRNYEANMAEVTSHLGEEIGPEFMEYLVSLGTDGANTLDHIAKTFEQDNGSEIISEWNQEFLDQMELEDEITDANARTLFALQNGFDNIGSTEADWSNLQDSLQTAVDMVGGIGDNLSQETYDAFQDAVTGAQQAGVQIPDGLAEGLESGELSVEAATEILNSALSGTFDSYAALAEEQGIEVSDSLASGVEQGGTAAAEAINTLTDEMMGAAESSASDLEQAEQGAIDTAMDNVDSGDAGQQVGQEMTGDVAEGAEEGQSEVESAMEEVVESATSVLEDSVSEFESAGQEIGEAIASGLESSADAIKTAIESALDDATAAADSIDVSGFETVGQQAAEAFGRGMAQGVSDTSAEDLAQAAIDALNEKTASFETPGNEAWNAYTMAIASGTSAAESDAGELADAAISALNSEVGSFESPGTDSGNSYGAGLDGSSSAVSSNASSVANAAVSALQNAAGSFTSPGTSAGANFASGIASQASVASSAAASCANAASSSVQGYYSSFYSAGSNMSAGVAAGISAGASAAITAATNMAISALNAAKAALDIASPSKKFRKDVGQQISTGMAFGIKDKASLAGDEATKMSNKVYKNATAWLNKYKKSHDTSLKDEKYYWQQVSKHCETGSTAYCNAIAKMIKADTSKKDSDGKKKDTETYYSEIFSSASDYLDNLEVLESWSLKDEMNYWTSVQKQLKKGTQAWYDAQKEINSIAANMGSIDDDTLSRAKKTLSNIEVMNDLSIDAEIAYWKSIRSGLTKYSDAWYEVTDTINSLKEENAKAADELYNQIIDAASEYVDQQTALDKMSLNEQLAYWEQIQKEVKKGSDAWYSAQKEINSIKSKIGTVSNMNNLLSAYTTYYDVSAKAEMQYWDAVRKQYTEGTDERLEADQQYFEAKKEYEEALEDLEDDYLKKVEDVNKQLESDIKSLTDSYDSAIESRTKELASAFGLFDEFTSQSATGQELLFNMQSQAAGYEAWNEAIQELSDRGILSDELLEELTDQGPDQLAAIYALSDLTDEELTAYQDAFDRKMTAIQNEVDVEMADLLAETEKQTEELKAQAEADIKALTEEYDADVAAVNEGISSDLQTLANNTKSIAEDQTAEIVAAISDSTTTLSSYFSAQSKAASSAGNAASNTAAGASGGEGSGGLSADDVTKILDLINAGKTKTSLTAKQRSSHTDLYCYLVDNYQRSLTTAQEKKLAKELDVDTSASNWKKKTLTALQKKGFAQGGVPDDEYAWMDEELNSIGPEFVVSRSDNALLTRLPAHSEIIDANTTDKLLELSNIDIGSMMKTISAQQSAITHYLATSTGTGLNNVTIEPVQPTVSTKGMESQMGNMYDLMTECIALLRDGQYIYLDSGKLIGATAEDMGIALAKRANRAR